MQNRKVENQEVNQTVNRKDSTEEGIISGWQKN